MQQVAFLRTSKSETDFLKGAAERIYKTGGKHGYGITSEKKHDRKTAKGGNLSAECPEERKTIRGYLTMRLTRLRERCCPLFNSSLRRRKESESLRNGKPKGETKRRIKQKRI